jgi:cell division protein FtsB
VQKLIFIIFVAIGLLFAGAVVVGTMQTIPPKWDNLRGLQHKRDELCAKIEAKKRAINTLKENQQRFKSDRDFVEMIARENKRVQPGELVFVFDQDFSK